MIILIHIYSVEASNIQLSLGEKIFLSSSNLFYDCFQRGGVWKRDINKEEVAIALGVLTECYITKKYFYRDVNKKKKSTYLLWFKVTTTAVASTKVLNFRLVSRWPWVSSRFSVPLILASNVLHFHYSTSKEEIIFFFCFHGVFFSCFLFFPVETS